MSSMGFVARRVVQCGGKRTFNTWAQAEHAMKRLRRDGRARDGVPHVYRCPHCGQYHVGSLARRTNTKLGRSRRYDDDRNQLARRLMLALDNEED